MFRKMSNKEASKKKRRKTTAIVILLCFVFLFLSVFVYYLKVVCPIVVSVSKDKIHSLATSSISESVGQVISQQNISYEQLVKISYSSQNDVELIEVDSVKVNLLMRDITNSVQHKFDEFSQKGISVALGTFTGIPFLYGVGPQITVQLVPVGAVKTALEGDFVSAGINQTLHSLNFVVSSTIGMVLPIKTESITTQLQVMICQSVIVGKIPNIYLQGQIM